MNLTDPLRPKTSAGLPALRLDGSAVPVIYLDHLTGDTVRLSVTLREHSGEAYSYTWRHATVDVDKIPGFLYGYYDNPELMLKHHFGWEDRPPSASRSIRAGLRPAASPTSSAELASMLDLL